jgi:hypothetical protein
MKNTFLSITLVSLSIVARIVILITMLWLSVEFFLSSFWQVGFLYLAVAFILFDITKEKYKEHFETI